MALSAVAQAANGPVQTNEDAAHQKADVAKKMQERIELLKKRIRAKNPAINIVTPTIPAPNTPPANVTPASQAPPHGVSTEDGQSNPGNPYASIVARNVFGLNPPPPPTTDTPQGAPPPKITLTGITTIFGPSEALYKVSGVPQPGKPPKDESYILKEGEEQDDVAVQRIDVAKGIVTFNNHGTVQDIPLAAGVASGGAPSSSGGQGGFQPPRSGFGRANAPNFNNFPPAVRERLQQRYGYGAYNNQNGNNFNPQGQNNNNNSGGYNPPGLPAGLSGDDAAALIAAQRAQLQQQGNPMATILPPTKYDDQANQEANGGNHPSAPPAP